MDSLDAQRLLIQVAEGDMRPPDLWCHHRSGALSCRYEGGEQVFSWSAEDVAELARRWRQSGSHSVPAEAGVLLDAHQRMEAMTREAGLAPPDMVKHDLGRAEIRAVWEDEEVVLVVEGIGESASASPPSAQCAAGGRQSSAPRRGRGARAA
jgi:hypothetical protein